MNSNLKALIAFILGGSIGSTVTYLVLKKREKKLLDELYTYFENKEGSKPTKKNVEDVEAFKKAVEESIRNTPPIVPEITEEDIAKYNKIISENDYDKMRESIYVISPEDVGEDADFETIELTYYADGVLTYMNDVKVPDPEISVGEDFASHFGEYEDDSVYIRNVSLGIDYAILRSDKTYREVLYDKPYLLENEEG